MEKNNRKINGAFDGNSVSPQSRGMHKHPKMPIELRAKQFMPFAAVTGLEAALREKEREHELQLQSIQQSCTMVEPVGI